MQSITEVEMQWKSHWAWHMGSAGTGTSSNNNDRPSAVERQLQSISDRLSNQLGGKGNGRWRGGKRQQGGGGKNGGNGQGNGQGQGKKRGNGGGQSQFNNNIPPKPNGNGGKGNMSAGRNAFAKRSKKGGGGK